MLQIHKRRTGGQLHKLIERTYVSLDKSRLARPKDELKSLLGNAGDEIDEKEAIRLGLLEDPVAEKKAKKPGENK